MKEYPAPPCGHPSSEGNKRKSHPAFGKPPSERNKRKSHLALRAYLR